MQAGVFWTSVDNVDMSEPGVSDVVHSNAPEHPQKHLNSRDSSKILIKTRPVLKRIEETNSFFFHMFQSLGLITVHWKIDHYSISRLHFTVSYIVWFFLPSALFGVSAYLKSIIVTGEKNDDFSHIATVFVIAVVPSVQAYTIKIVNSKLPTVFYKMAEIDGMSEHPKKPFKIMETILPLLFLAKAEKGESCSIISFFPIASVLLSIGVFWVMWTISFLNIIEILSVDLIIDEWVPLTLLVVYSIAAHLSTWFCVLILEWFRKTYGSVHKAIGKTSDENLLDLNNSLDRLFECFLEVRDSFLAYICTINLAINVISATFSFVKMISGIEMIFYFVPFSFNAHMIWLIGFESSKVLDQVFQYDMLTTF